MEQSQDFGVPWSFNLDNTSILFHFFLKHLSFSHTPSHDRQHALDQLPIKNNDIKKITLPETNIIF